MPAGKRLGLQHLQRLRRNGDITAAPLLAASIFLDILNVFLFFLTIFSGGRGNERRR